MPPKENDPFAEFERLTTEIEEMFLRFYTAPRLRMMKAGAFQPLADVFFDRKARAVTVKLELPGITPDQVQMSLQSKTLVIEGVRVEPQKEGEKVYQQMEIDYGPFRRKIMLPVAVNIRRSRARYEDGFLTIELPVVKKESPAVKVSITVKDG